MALPDLPPPACGKSGTTASRGDPLGVFLRRHSLVDLANFSFLGVLLFFYALALPHLPRRPLPLLAYLSLFLLLAVTVRLRETNGFGRLNPYLLFALPAAFLFLAFESLALTLPFVNPHRYDAVMAALDFALFGVHPTVWLERLAHPLLTELSYLFYLVYFPMPVILLVWMLAKGRYEAAGDALFRLLSCYYGAYVLYFLLPVEGPRFFLAGRQGAGLEGYLLSEPIRRMIDLLEPNKLDAFPSLHAAILAVVLAIAYRENRAMFRAFLPLGAGITASLVYLRYHYVADVVAGFAWAAASFSLSGLLISRFGRRCALHFREGT